MEADLHMERYKNNDVASNHHFNIEDEIYRKVKQEMEHVMSTQIQNEAKVKDNIQGEDSYNGSGDNSQDSEDTENGKNVMPNPGKLLILDEKEDKLYSHEDFTENQTNGLNDEQQGSPETEPTMYIKDDVMENGLITVSKNEENSCSDTEENAPAMYILNVDSPAPSPLVPMVTNQNRRKRKGAVPKKIVKHEIESDLLVAYTCSMCDARFERKKDLIGHMRTHNTKDPVVHICKVCGEQFSSKKKLFSHAKIHRQNIVHKCSECGEQFSKKIEYKKHMKIHLGPRRYPCELCGKECGRKAELIGHMRTHTGEKPFVCPTCGKGFGFRHHLKGHLRIHSGEKPFICDKCGRGFNDRSSMRRHAKIHEEEAAILEAAINGMTDEAMEKIRRIRPRKIYERSHKCEICGKSFIKGQHLRVHIRTHTGEKPHQCDACGKQFNDPSSLRRHVKTFAGRPHGVALTHEKEFKCHICNKEFGYRRNYRNHLKAHSEGNLHECSTCNKNFHSKHSLRVHMTKHMVEKPYKCAICDKRFSSYGNWYCHHKTHNLKGPKRLQCSECGKFFMTVAHLKCHLKAHKYGRLAVDLGPKPINIESITQTEKEPDEFEICKNCGDMFPDKESLEEHDCLMGSLTKVKIPENENTNQNSNLSSTEQSEPESSQMSQDFNQRQFISGVQLNSSFVSDFSENSFSSPIFPRNETFDLNTDSFDKSIEFFDKGDNPSLIQDNVDKLVKIAPKPEKLPSLKMTIKLKPYPCTECNKSFHLKSSLSTHFKIHTGENLHKCKICDKVFTKKYNYTRHIKSCESKNGLNESTDHDSDSPKKPKPHQCTMCNKSFTNKYSLTEHFRIHTGQNVHECLVCGKKFPKLYNFKRHIQSCRNGLLKEIPDDRSLVSNSNSLTAASISLLDASNTSFNERTRSEPMKDEDTSDNMCDESSFNAYLQSQENAPHSCYVCEETFPSLKTLKRHMQTHTKEEKKDKTLKKPYQCSECDKSFSEKGTLVTHFRLHTGKNLLECDVCGKKFTKNYNFLRHVRTHTGDKPHKCAHCPRQFGDSSSLTRHMVVKHSLTGSFSCHVCSARFFSESTLESHLMTHDQAGFEDMTFDEETGLPIFGGNISTADESDSSAMMNFSSKTSQNLDEDSSEYEVKVKIEPQDDM